MDPTPGIDPPRGMGALLTTEVLEHPLGRYGARELTAHVQRHRFRLGFGAGGRWGVTLERLRPVAIAVSEGGHISRTAIAAPPDPWLQAARRLLLWATALWLLRRLAGSVQRRHRHANGA